ncbi:MAG: hypothetical protein M1824_000407 [Vezdaea acicularis]|nr:MAG: hypothetical protein M1824_000407 [Vezdaea acicularis]
MADASSSPAFTLEEAYADAVAQLERLQQAGHLSLVDYNIVVDTRRPEELLAIINDAATRSAKSHPDAKKRVQRVVEPLLMRLERFGSAIDLLAQCSPQITGVNIVGLIWGSVKFLLVIARDIIDTFQSVLNTLDSIFKALPVLDIYHKLFGSSNIQLIRAPLVKMYAEFVAFAVQAVKSFNRSEMRTLVRSAWSSLQKELKLCIIRIEKAGEDLDKAAQIEHLNQAEQMHSNLKLEIEKQERFRREVRLYFGQTIDSRISTDFALPPLNDAPIDLLSVHFYGRNQEIELLGRLFQKKYGDSPTRCAIHGMPGLGKTQLALKYVKVSYDLKRYSHVFWISAATIERLNQGFSKMLDLLNHTDRYHPEQNTKLTAARRWLETSQSGSSRTWLLIFDNVNIDTLEFIREHLPRQNSQGNILFTTRTDGIAKAVVHAAGEQHQVLELQTPSVDDAAKLLLDHSEIDESKVPSALTKARRLVESVGCLPLAIGQAASFMKQSHKTLDDLLVLYRDEHKFQVLSWENDLTSYEQKSVTATFVSQFDTLDRLHPETSSLLKILSFLDPEGIPVDMIVEGAKTLLQQPSSTMLLDNSAQASRSVTRLAHIFKRKQRKRQTPISLSENGSSQKSDISCDPIIWSRLEALAQTPIQLQKAIQQLQNHSLVEHLLDVNTPILRLHDLIQFMVQQRVKVERTENENFILATTVVCNAFQKVRNPESSKSWVQCEMYIPHIQSLLARDSVHGQNALRLFWAGADIARYMGVRGRFEEAANILKRTLEGCERQLGPDREDTLRMRHALGNLLMNQGQYAEAEELFRRVLKRREEIDSDSPDTLRAMGGLASAHVAQGQCLEAEQLYLKVLENLEKQIGKEHPDTLRTLDGLAWVYSYQGQYSKAKDLYIRGLQGWQKLMGTNNPEALRAMRNLANVYCQQMAYSQAESLYKRALEESEKELGWDHLSTLEAAGGLAIAYSSQSRYQEAEQLYKRALLGFQKYLKPEHPQITTILHNLALVYSNLDRHSEAEELYRQALEGEEKHLGPNHPETLGTVNNLAMFYVNQGRYTAAEQLYSRALEGRKKCLGHDHPETLKTLDNIATLRQLMNAPSMTPG